MNRTLIFLAIVLLPFAFSETIEDLSEKSIASPESMPPSECLDGTLYVAGGCGCKFIVNRELQIKKGRSVRALCKMVFGPKRKDINNLGLDCGRFMNKKGAPKGKKVLKETQKFLDRCYPEYTITLTPKVKKTKK